ncbi:MAG: 2-C-methyl-D-erythritol 2,4-cyclodiphosphate synthase [Candidatus Riflebacteria bacterium]|nr:2-C-methyl-D-erythritol 2,4-cyclodiphosphate synthase [Candidatus Riflebacteria bacterium]
MTGLRIGSGQDIHAFAAGRELWLGGVRIPHEKGLAGHSDADALVHAVMDAILGALALGDIGMHFPDTDARYKGISSLELLARVRQLMTEAGFRVANLDTMICCETPKIGPHREAIRRSLAQALGVGTDAVSVKAGTREKFDAVGRGEALECHAVVLLERVP